MIKKCFEPIYNNHSKMLILGSIPSVKSLKSNFYYMHPRNQFWKILDAIFYQTPTFEKAVEEYRKTLNNNKREVIKNLLLENHIALFDTIKECEGEGSLDTNIRKESINTNKETISIILEVVDIVYLNGSKAYELFIKMFPDISIPVIKLPSTSPAHTMSLEKKLEVWKQIKK